jgi:AcrR family transcriptional regulator
MNDHQDHGRDAQADPDQGHPDQGRSDHGHSDHGHPDQSHPEQSHSDHGRSDTRRDTRARIQRVALELFAERGYDGTSLREIAERLDVTKAALYYHFKSKEDIVGSLVEDYFGQIDELIAWAGAQPRTPKTRAVVLSRYVRIVANGSDVFRMLHHNQAAVNTLASAKHRGDVFRERMAGLVDALAGPEPDLPERLRATMVLGAISIGWMFFADKTDDRHKLTAAVLDIAAEFDRADLASLGEPGAGASQPGESGAGHQV